MFEKINLEQGSQEWIAFRQTHIGASDAASVLEVSPYRPAHQQRKSLLNEKRWGSTDYDNPAMARGRAVEPLMRIRYEEELGIPVSAAVVKSTAYPWMIASLDGLSWDGKKAVEIKTCGTIVHEDARKGIIRKDYYAQLQHQMCVLGFDSIDYLSWCEGDYFIITVDRDQAYIDNLLVEEKKVYDEMTSPDLSTYPQTTLFPPHLGDEYREAKENYERAKAILEDVRTSILSYCEGRDVGVGGGVVAKKVMTVGRIDYSKIPELKGVNLDLYRGKTTESWRITTD